MPSICAGVCAMVCALCISDDQRPLDVPGGRVPGGRFALIHTPSWISLRLHEWHGGNAKWGTFSQFPLAELQTTG